ncbi:MAG: NADH:flavin oxidoreductase [Christensenella sp.]|nr:NADH:flavin oxidoreductase [Christensenella sp.]
MEKEKSTMKALFDHTKINNLDLQNRFARSGTWLGFAQKNGHLNEAVYKIYEDLAKGGTGLLFTSFAYITEEEHPNNRMIGIYDDSFIPEYHKLAEIVHAQNVKIVAQIVYGGSQNICYEEDKKKMYIIGPSAVFNERSGITPVVASKEDINVLAENFAAAALRAKKAGIDGVQIHAAHGYMLSQWLTPFFNRRTDEYGGDIHNRARIIYEVYTAVRKAVGNEYPVMIKLNCSDFMKEEGLTEEDAMKVCTQLDEMGIDLIEVSGGNTSGVGNFEKTARKHLHKVEDQSYFWMFASQAARRMKHAKIMLTGGNLNYRRMENLLNQTDIEYFGLSRALICEPDLVTRWKKDPEYIARCVSCNGCLNKNGRDINEEVQCVFKTGRREAK